MVVDFGFPEQPPGCGVQAVNIGPHVAEVDRELTGTLAFHFPDADGIANPGPRLKRPVDATSSCIERINISIVEAHENTPRGHRRLPVYRRRTGKTEGPFQL